MASDVFVILEAERSARVAVTKERCR